MQADELIESTPIIYQFPELRPLQPLDGSFVKFTWRDCAGVSVAMRLAAIRYMGKDQVSQVSRLAIVAIEDCPENYPLAHIDCEIRTDTRIAIISKGMDLIFDHPDLLKQHRIAPKSRDNEPPVFPFFRVDRFSKTDLSQIVLVTMKLLLENLGIDSFAVWEDATIKSIPDFPYVKSAYFKYASPLTEFIPVSEGSIPNRKDGYIGKVYQVATRISQREFQLLKRPWERKEYI